MLTVREILGTLPAKTKVVAGKAGLGREVTWAVGLRTRPPIFPTLKGGEFALVAVAALSQLEPPVQLADAVSRLGDRGVAAVGAVGAIDSAAIAESERRELPLLALPEDTLLSELESTLLRLIGEQRTELYQWGIEVEHCLADASIRGDGLVGMVALLADLLKTPVIWQDAMGRLTAVEIPSAVPVTLAEVKESLSEAVVAGSPRLLATNNAVKLPCSLAGWARWGVRVSVARSTVGQLSLLVPTERTGSRERLALERAVWAFAQEAAKERAVQAAESRLRGDYLNALLTAPARELAEIQQRSRHVGIELTLPHETIVFGTQGGSAAVDDADQVFEVVERRLGHVTAGFGDLHFRLDAGHLVALVPETASGKRIATEVVATVRQMIGSTGLAAGVGRPYTGAEGVRRSYQEATTALEIGVGLRGGGQVTAFADLGAYRLLYALRDHPELAGFFVETLGVLQRYDRENNTELLRTLETYFACDGVMSQAADQLYLHRNSLAYRLRRIEDITGLSLESAEARFRMQLALKIWRLLPRAGD